MDTPKRPPEWAEAVKRLVDAAPPLTPEQADKLATLLRLDQAVRRVTTRHAGLLKRLGEA